MNRIFNFCGIALFTVAIALSFSSCSEDDISNSEPELPSNSRYDFITKNDEGIDIFYKVTTNSGNVCGVSYGDLEHGSYSGDIKIPKEVTYNNVIYKVTTIEDRAFSNCSKLKNIVLPESIISIDNFAFDKCISLTNIELPTNLKTIEYGAFQFSGITAINIPDAVTSINNFAFYGCKSLTSVKLSNKITNIGYFTFAECGIDNFILPENITNLKDCSFSGSKLSSIVVPESIVEYGTGVFQHCVNLKSAIFPNNFSEIKENTFLNCTNLSSFTILSKIKKISKSAFEKSGLETIIIPKGVETIENSAFRESQLKDLIIEGGNEILNLGYNINNTYTAGLFVNCPLETLFLGRNLTYGTLSASGYSPFYNQITLKKVTIGDSVTSIGNNAFSGCSGLSSIIIPNSVTSIESSAFSGCSGLTSVTIGNNIISIGPSAFSGCSGLIEINSLNPIPPTGVSFETKVYTNATLNVPIGSLDAYKSADGWKDFLNIKEIK